MEYGEKVMKAFECMFDKALKKEDGISLEKTSWNHRINKKEGDTNYTLGAIQFNCYTNEIKTPWYSKNKSEDVKESDFTVYDIKNGEYFRHVSKDEEVYNYWQKKLLDRRSEMLDSLMC